MELVERACGLSVFDAHARACTSGALPAPDGGAESLVYGKAIVFARRGDCRRYPRVAGRPHRPRHSSPRTRITSRQPVCTVLAHGADAAACYQALVNRAGPSTHSWRGGPGPLHDHRLGPAGRGPDVGALERRHASGSHPGRAAPRHQGRGLRHSVAGRGAERGAAVRMEDRGDEQGRPGAHRRGWPDGRAVAAREGVRERRHGAVWRQLHARG